LYASVVQQKLASCIIELCVCMQVSSVHRNTQDLHWRDGTGDVGRLPPGSPSTPVTYPRNTSDGKIDSPGRIKSICVTKSELQFSIRYNPWLVTDSQQILILNWVRMSYFISFSFRFQFLGFLVWHYSIMQDCTTDYKIIPTNNHCQTTTLHLQPIWAHLQFDHVCSESNCFWPWIIELFSSMVNCPSLTCTPVMSVCVHLQWRV